MPIPRELLTFWFCIFIAGPTLAADYWISIGSFKDRGAAEQGLIDARKRSSQNIAVVAQPSEDGIRYRVSAGPFTTKNEAQSALTQIKEDGFGGAWVWQLKEYVGGDASSSLLNPSEEYIGLADMIFDNLPETSTEPANSEIPGVSISVRSMEVPKAPPGYQLNKLRRDN